MNKHDMYLIHGPDTYVEMWELKLYFTHPPEDEKRKKRKAYLVPGAVHARTQQTTYTNQRYGRLSVGLNRLCEE